ncbi:hypothetical protein VE03_10557 [Pseudogymnoascus sp. 23342-1-I1]|nr:hypothetical protein VE03_10557 [Pseudogymnoascus sp. 23342-1-I1]
MISKHDWAYARKYGIETRFARPAQVKEYHAGATALLAHFHLCHNSSYPFSAAGEKADVLIAAGLSGSQILFIQDTRKFVTDNGNTIFKGNDACEDDCYYISQLIEYDLHTLINIRGPTPGAAVDHPGHGYTSKPLEVNPGRTKIQAVSNLGKSRADRR